MKDFYFDKTKDEEPVTLTVVPPKLEKNPITLNITPLMATILELIVNFGNDKKVTFKELIEKAQELEGNKNLTQQKLRQVLENIRDYFQKLGTTNGLLILPNHVVLQAKIEVQKNEESDDLLDFIYRDLVQDKH